MNIKEAIIILQNSLLLDRKIVAVNLIDTEENFSKCTEKAVKNKMCYCVMVKLATKGYSMKANLENFACLGSAKALGLIEPPERHKTGEHYNSLGLYCDLNISRNMVANMVYIDKRYYGITINPAEDLDDMADMYIVISSSYNIMRLTQAYAYYNGMNTNMRISGNQAICAECSSYPYMSGNVNISMLCAGTRHMAGYREDEVAMGIPKTKIIELAEGVLKTLNATENDKRKIKIKEAMHSAGYTDFTVELHKNYFTGGYLR